MLETNSRSKAADRLSAMNQSKAQVTPRSAGTISAATIQQNSLNLGQFQSRRCPCCGSGKAISTSLVRSELPAERRQLDEIRETWQHFFKKSSYFTYQRCASCGQLYCPVFFQPEQLAALYSKMSDNTAHLPVAILKRTQRRYFEILQKYSATSGVYLELGPDIGLLTEMSVSLGHFSRAILIEPNQLVHESLEKSVGGIPHQIISDFYGYRLIEDRSIDTAVVVHVLDHLLDPNEFLRTIKKKLRPGGKMLLVTHDESSVLARALGGAWPGYCLQHPQLYNPKSITRCLENHGYRVLGVQKTYNDFPMTYLLRHLLWALKFGDMKLPDWPNLTIPLKLGNIATVVSV